MWLICGLQQQLQAQANYSSGPKFDDYNIAITEFYALYTHFVRITRRQMRLKTYWNLLPHELKGFRTNFIASRIATNFHNLNDKKI